MSPHVRGEPEPVKAERHKLQESAPYDQPHKDRSTREESDRLVPRPRRQC
jgi:hypothetical protein